MNIAAKIIEPRLINISITEDEIIAYLADGRTVSVPLAWSWRLSDATPKQRLDFEIIGDGYGVWWPEIDEDLSVDGMLYGVPASAPKIKKRPCNEKISSPKKISKSISETEARLDSSGI